MRRAIVVLAAVGLGSGAVAASAAGAAGCEPIRLRDVAIESGVDFRHQNGASEAKHLPETMGSGLAWLDFDGDGWLDLYLVQSGTFPPDPAEPPRDRLYRNLGNGRFAAVEGLPLGGRERYGQGVTAADADGDGDTDLYLTNYGDDALLVNRGDGRFAEATAAAGLGLGGWSSSAAFADADGDGDLDLYVTRYVRFDPEEALYCGDPLAGRRQYCDPSLFEGDLDVYYRNLGEGRFEPATEEAGLAGADGRGLGVLFADLDDDLAPDLYVANDLTLNLLFRNLGGGRFRDESLVSGAAVNGEGKPEAGMGLALGDVDGDGDPDLAVTNFDVETNTLYRNDGDLAFSDVSAASAFGPPSFNRLAFGIQAADLDRDGDVDFYVANGHIFPEPRRENVAYRQPDLVLLGDGRGGFRPACEDAGAHPTVARGLAGADYDNDGDVDLAAQENGGLARLLRNDVETGGWLGVRLVGRPPNPLAVGARVEVAAPGPQRRWVLAGDSYQSSSDPRLLFGLGEAAGAAGLEVRWPSGRRSRFLDPPRDRWLVTVEPPGSEDAGR